MFYLIFCGGAGGGVFKNTTLFAVLPSDHCSVYKFAPFEVWLITFKVFWFPAREREPAGKSNCDVAVVAGVRMISCWYLYQELYFCDYYNKYVRNKNVFGDYNSLQLVTFFDDPWAMSGSSYVCSNNSKC